MAGGYKLRLRQGTVLPRAVFVVAVGFFVGLVCYLVSENLPIGLLACVLAAGLLFLVMLAFDRSRALRVELGEQELRVRGDLFGKPVPYGRMDVARASVEDLTQPGPLRPRWKLLGSAMPGYYAGTFSLRNKCKALVFLSSMQSVVAVPLDENEYLILGVENPELFLEDLRKQAAGARDRQV